MVIKDQQELQFVTAEYDGLPVVFQPDGYINATQIAKRFGKQSTDFLKLSSTADYINALIADSQTENSLSGQMSYESMVVVQRGGAYPGTWLHPNLAVVFARWCDARFAVWCDRQIKDLLNQGGDRQAIITESQRFLLERFTLNAGSVHPHYFDVFHKSFDVMNFLVANGFIVNSHNVPDISIGQATGKFWRDNPEFAANHGDRVKLLDMQHVYPESCPQSKAYDQIIPWCYPMSWLPKFEEFMKTTYMTEKLPNYLATKVRNKQLGQKARFQIANAIKQSITLHSSK